jgi:hypothetical protein
MVDADAQYVFASSRFGRSRRLNFPGLERLAVTWYCVGSIARHLHKKDGGSEPLSFLCMMNGMNLSVWGFPAIFMRLCRSPYL